MEPVVLKRPEHNVSRQNISSAAIKVLYRLKDEGYTAYIAGGGVRDLLLKRQPKDFDVVTDATPEQIRKMFRNCRLIGRRFRLAHILFRGEVIETATFRAPVPEDEEAHCENTFQSCGRYHGSLWNGKRSSPSLLQMSALGPRMAILTTGLLAWKTSAP